MGLCRRAPWDTRHFGAPSEGARICGNLSGSFDAALDMSGDFSTVRARVPVGSFVDIALKKEYSNVRLPCTEVGGSCTICIGNRGDIPAYTHDRREGRLWHRLG